MEFKNAVLPDWLKNLTGENVIRDWEICRAFREHFWATDHTFRPEDITIKSVLPPRVTKDVMSGENYQIMLWFFYSLQDKLQTGRGEFRASLRKYLYIAECGHEQRQLHESEPGKNPLPEELGYYYEISTEPIAAGKDVMPLEASLLSTPLTIDDMKVGKTRRFCAI